MPDSTPSEVTYYFQKSPDFRTIHVDGAFGGLTPQANVSLSFFSERFAIPQSTIHSVVGGVLGPEIARNVKPGIVREMEINCIMDIHTTKQVIEFLQNKVKDAENLGGPAK